jgi:hypothetical protein
MVISLGVVLLATWCVLSGGGGFRLMHFAILVSDDSMRGMSSSLQYYTMMLAKVCMYLGSR